MTISSKLVTITLLCFIGHSQLLAQQNWLLKKNASGISVYTSNVEGSGFIAFKTVAAFSASGLNEIASILIDIDNYKKIFSDTYECHIIKKNGDADILHYMQTTSPWPADNRDGVYELKSQYNKSLNEVIIRTKCIKSDYQQSSKVVRMTKGEGYWKIKEIKNSLYEVTFEFHGEPAGKVPAWLANSFVVSHTFKTFRNLKSVIASGKYKNSNVDFIN